jgi:hypothetical protein
MATGGAVSPDGRLLALRTYTDAYVWPLSGSDVAGALSGAPVRVALPEAPQGEGLSFATDDQQLVVSGEGVPTDVTIVPIPQQAVQQTTPAASAAPASAAAATTAADGTRLTPPSFTTALVAAAIATAVVWLGSRLLRLRRRRD